MAAHPDLWRLSRAAAAELHQLFSDLPVQQSIEERVDRKGGVGQPSHRLLQVPRALQGAGQRHVQVENEEWQPAEQELTHDENQSEGSLAPTEGPLWRQASLGQSMAAGDHGGLAVDGVWTVLGEVGVGPNRHGGDQLQGCWASHLVDGAVNGKDDHRRNQETDHSEEYGEHASQPAVAGVERAVGCSDRALVPVRRPPKHGDQSQEGRLHPDQEHDADGEVDGHLDLVVHRVNDVEVALYADGCDGEDGETDEEDVEENVNLTLQNSEGHRAEERRAAYDA